MTRPVLLDLFCCAGLAAEGYHRAGWDIVGVDCRPQRHYPFEYHVDDALGFASKYGRHFAAVHASPPCQAYSCAGTVRSRKPDLLNLCESWLARLDCPAILENVPPAPFTWPTVTLCGSVFGLAVLRHRKFGLHRWHVVPPPCCHRGYATEGDYLTVTTHATTCRLARRAGVRADVATACRAMGTQRLLPLADLGEGVPPAYTAWLGANLLAHLGHDYRRLARRPQRLPAWADGARL